MKSKVVMQRSKWTKHGCVRRCGTNNRALATPAITRRVAFCDRTFARRGRTARGPRRSWRAALRRYAAPETVCCPETICCPETVCSSHDICRNSESISCDSCGHALCTSLPGAPGRFGRSSQSGVRGRRKSGLRPLLLAQGFTKRKVVRLPEVLVRDTGLGLQSPDGHRLGPARSRCAPRARARNIAKAFITDARQGGERKAPSQAGSCPGSGAAFSRSSITRQYVFLKRVFNAERLSHGKKHTPVYTASLMRRPNTDETQE